MEPFQHTRHIQKYKRRLGMQYANYNQNGDKNTRFFHNLVNRKRKRLQVKRILKRDGVWTNDAEEVATEAVAFFQDLFTDVENEIELSLIEHIPTLVTDEDNTMLNASPIVEEIKKVVFELNSDSASGPDGFTGHFYQVCWDFVGRDVVNVVEAFFNVISRVIHDRLERLLPRLISPNQPGFVKGRSITENVLLAQEIIADIRLRGRPANVVIKLYMSKACDRVNWIFLIKVMDKIGFNSFVADKVCRLVANNWYSVLINGQAHGFFHSSRGVEQGDPLSPTLFILAAEVLSRALNNLFHNQDFTRYGMPKWSDVIYSLAYADDTVIFIIAEKKSLDLVMERLGIYEDQSGQMINKEKSCFYVLFAKLLWNSKEEGRSKQWISWYDICRHKEEGGLSFRSLFDMSKAMFAKLW
ncbi:hypothetical protein KY284_015095 [Solanum tuberosum]|nr:hypothetical protein KY284_015095 [Solanum tuberosum]